MIKFKAILISILLHAAAFSLLIWVSAEVNSSQLLLSEENMLLQHVKVQRVQLFYEPLEKPEVVTVPKPVVERVYENLGLQESPDGEFTAIEEVEEIEPAPVPEPKPIESKDQVVQKKHEWEPETYPEIEEQHSLPLSQDEITAESPTAHSTAEVPAISLADEVQALNGAVAGQNQMESDLWQDYKREVFNAINAQRVYPKQARLRGLEGTVIMQFTVALNGRVDSYQIVEKSKAKILNRSAQQLFQKLNLPKPPYELSNRFPAELSIPLQYRLIN